MENGDAKASRPPSEDEGTNYDKNGWQREKRRENCHKVDRDDRESVLCLRSMYCVQHQVRL